MTGVGLESLKREVWTPPSFKEAQERNAARAVEEYDSGLMLGYRKDVNEWVVFIRNGPNGEPFPVLGLGRELPHPDTIKQRLYHADTKRRGPQIVAQIDRHNEAIKQAARDRAADAAVVAAEGMEWASRKLGLRGNGKVFIPKGVRA